MKVSVELVDASNVPLAAVSQPEVVKRLCPKQEQVRVAAFNASL